MTTTALALMTDDELASFARDPEAGYGCLRSERGVLPLVALHVRAEVSGVVAATSVTQTFANTTGFAIEATYIFPLPDRAAVRRFRMEVNGRLVEGIVEERGAARDGYDRAIAAGQRAAIAEEERPGVFTLRVGNLMPGERATIELSLVGPLPIDDGEVTFQFPLVVAPRYIPGNELGGEQAGLGVAGDTDLVPDASRISPPVRLPGMRNPVQLELEVAFERAPKGIASSLHAVSDDGRTIRVQPHPGGRSGAQPGSNDRLDRDFILRWRIDEAELASSLVCADDADGRAGTFMLTLVPPSTRATAQKPRDVVIVIDRSGSMGGWKMVAARRAAARLIDSLTSRDRFCAIAFDDHIEAIPSRGLADATDRARFRAVESLAKIDARGGTELAQPLEAAVDLLAGGYADRERVVVLVTDGQVGNEDDVLRMLAPKIKNVRVFTLGIDQAVNAAFLRRLAGVGAGMCELVESEDRLDAVMAKFHRRIGAPIASELAVTPTGLEIEPGSLSPARVPDVYAGAPVVVMGRYVGAAPANAAIELDGVALGDPFHVRVTRTAAGATASDWLGASWARARIRDLEDRYAANEHHHEPAIVALSKRFNVLSRFTAFLAVDRNEVANPGGRLTQIVQPVEEPAGWQLAKTLAGGAAMPQSMAMPAGAMPPMPPMSRPMSPPMSRPMSIASPAPMAPMAKKSPSIAQNVARAVSRVASSIVTSSHRKREQADGDELAATPISAAPYLAKLGELAVAFAAAAEHEVRELRQRLADWVEDVRSVGLDKLAREVDVLVARLRAKLDAGTAKAIARELEAIAMRGDANSSGRRAFWK
ncbi:MAG TPA: VIT domain-containing protein [Kofleriaceae bacterium]|nr:VIT domain-containing protein [Kofleriaceae bacterium]